jgi:hypothetical protein
MIIPLIALFIYTYGPFSLCVIHKEGLCPSSGGIDWLMMMMTYILTSRFYSILRSYLQSGRVVPEVIFWRKRIVCDYEILCVTKGTEEILCTLEWFLVSERRHSLLLHINYLAFLVDHLRCISLPLGRSGRYSNPMQTHARKHSRIILASTRKHIREFAKISKLFPSVFSALKRERISTKKHRPNRKVTV